MFRRIITRVTRMVVTPPTRSLSDLINTESHIGGQVFGQPSKGVTRRFFLDETNNWYYHETAKNSNGEQLYNFTIRYEILPQGVLKSVDGKNHTFIGGVELDNLKQAIKLYTQRIKAELYATQA